MAGAVLGLRVPGLVVENVGTVAKTLPGFVGLWDRMITGSRHHTPAASA